jgi:zinc/manganese transport system substrate-binding protein
MRRLATLVALFLAWGIGSASARDLAVVASFTVLADMVEQVGGAHVEVRSLVGRNGDPHMYEPTPADAQALAHADLVFVSGLGLEGWMDRLIAASGYKGRIIVASQGVETRTMAEEEGGRTRIITDPHLWNSAANGAAFAATIATALAGADPEHATGYRANGARYAAELRALDGWARAEIAAVPEAKRKLITSHDAFGYLGAAYGIELRAPVGFSTESEPSAEQVASLIEQIRREGIKAVFVENTIDPRLVQQIARETGAKIGGLLYAEALSEPGGPAPSYTAMFRYNITAMKQGMLAN